MDREQVRTEAFQPRWVSSPGETVADALRARQLGLPEFSAATGVAVEELVGLLEGRTAITIELARSLCKVLGGSVPFWMNRDHLYREAANKLTAENRDWLQSLPLSDMVRLGWLRPAPRATEEVAAVLQFFGVASMEAWQESYGKIAALTAFRTSAAFDSSPGSVAVWLREAEIQAESIECKPWNPVKFQGVLSAARELTRVGDPQRFLPKLRQLCAMAGVAVVVLRGPTGCRASGATRFLSNDKALLLLSARHLTDDHFWFTFFHEAGHLVLHGQSALFVEGLGETQQEDLFESLEQEANVFANEVLIPPTYQKAVSEIPKDSRAIQRLAARIGISSGVLVGQLQHVGRLRRNQLNSLKRRYIWQEAGQSPAKRQRQPLKNT